MTLKGSGISYEEENEYKSYVDNALFSKGIVCMLGSALFIASIPCLLSPMIILFLLQNEY